MAPSIRPELIKSASDSFNSYYKNNHSADLPSLEDLLQAFVNEREREEQSKWGQAAALLIMREGLKLKVKDISAYTGLSPAMVREMIRTFAAFPLPEKRAQDLSFYHHRLASTTINPQKWLEEAVINSWSTRQLAEEIRLSRVTSEEAKKKVVLAKAEKAIRMVKEIIENGGDAAEYIFDCLVEIILEQTAA